MNRVALSRCSPLFTGISVVLAAAIVGCGGQVIVDPNACPPGAFCLPVDGGDDASTKDDARSDGIGIDPDGSPATCGGGVCPYAGFTCSDGCNSCSCSGAGWACTARDCRDAGAPCPAKIPAPGDGCAGSDGVKCAYAEPCGATSTAYCSAAHWLVDTATCKPPPGCPASPPIGGIPCSQAAGTTCAYPNGCGGKIIGECASTKTWVVSTDPCTTPTCPIAEPAAGTACSGNLECGYTTACGANDTSVCIDDPSGKRSWQTYAGTCPGATCPTSEPKPFSACSADLSCSWMSACGATDTATCATRAGGGKTWSIAVGACSSGCPAKPAPMGSACVGFAACRYSNGCGGVVDSFCKGGTWQTFPNACVPGCPATIPPSGVKCTTPSSSACLYVPGPDPACTQSCFCATDGRWACLPIVCSGGGAPPTPG